MSTPQRFPSEKKATSYTTETNGPNDSHGAVYDLIENSHTHAPVEILGPFWSKSTIKELDRRVDILEEPAISTAILRPLGMSSRGKH